MAHSQTPVLHVISGVEKNIMIFTTQKCLAKLRESIIICACAIRVKLGRQERKTGEIKQAHKGIAFESSQFCGKLLLK